MEFYQGTTLDDFVDKTVDLILTAKPGSNNVSIVETCETFLIDEELHVDPIPRLQRRYAFKIPESAIFSKNEKELSLGRWGIIIQRDTEAGILLQTLLDAKENLGKNAQ